MGARRLDRTHGTNRPNPKLVENVSVDYMGTPMTVKQLATINIEPPKDIVIAPWDRASIPAVEKALKDAGMGLNVAAQGNVIRAKLPEMTQERVEEFIKLVKASAEQSKIRIRMLRDDINKKLKDIKDEDQKFRSKDEVQKKVDSANKEIESVLEAKIIEIK